MDLTTLSDDELTTHLNEVLHEQERRQRLATAPQQVTQIAQAYIADGGDLATLTDALSGTTA